MAAPSVTPEAIPRRLGRYSCPSTTVIAKVPTTVNPTTAIRTNASPVGASMKAASAGPARARQASRIVRRPSRSATRPPITVPAAPAASMAVSAMLPAASEVPSVVTNQTGTKLSRPKCTHERSEMTPVRRANAPHLVLPGGLRGRLGRRRAADAQPVQPARFAARIVPGGDRDEAEHERAAQAEREDAAGGQHGAEGEPGVAAEGEQAHAARLGDARGVVGMAGALGWKAATPMPDRTIAANVSA